MQPKKGFNHFFNKDVVFSTVFVFLGVLLLKYSVVHLHALDPIEKALSDFDYNDLVFKHRSENTLPAEGNVVVVELGKTRAEIAREIAEINSHHPAVVAVDAWFLKQREPQVDSLLLTALAGSPKLVLGSYLKAGEGEAHEQLSYQQSFEALRRLGANGFVNFVGEYEKTIRYFKPKEQIDGKEVNSFAAEIVKQYAPEKFKKLEEREGEVEFINYTRNRQHFVPVIHVDEVTPGNPALDVLKGKIVILGTVDPNDLEDLHFTPFNKALAGRSKPDLNGAFIQANIVEMILAENYVNQVPWLIAFLVAVLLTYAAIIFNVFYFVEKHIWYHFFAKLLQLVFLALLIFAKLQLLRTFNLSLDEGIIAVPVILSVDLLYFYDALVKWMHQRFGYQSYFLQHGKEK